jgi:hypothetical protein
MNDRPDRNPTTRTIADEPWPSPLGDAVDRMASVFGSPGKAALKLFLASLPSDATICWGEEEWLPADVLAQSLERELADHG